ncbi:MAG: bacteriohemerythrin [Desulfovibrionaceae bacterium]
MSPIIQWSEDMAIGVRAIDEQHKQFVMLIDRAYQASLEGSSPERVRLMIQDMKEYALGHFEVEEGSMIDSSYPGLEEHRAGHQEFLRRTAELESSRATPESMLDVFLFLADWLRTHILREDLKFGDYLRELDPAAPSSSNR